jgi:glycerate kinase
VPESPDVICLVDVNAPLFGPDGAAHRFAAQKGATSSEIELLDAGLRHLAVVLPGRPDEPGSGAAGGTAYGLVSGFGARILPGAATVAEMVGLPDAVARADLVLTGEGKLDETSLMGKVVGHVLACVNDRTPVHVVAGQTVDLDATGVASTTSLTHLAGSAAAAMKDPNSWLEVAAQRIAERIETSA